MSERRRLVRLALLAASLLLPLPAASAEEPSAAAPPTDELARGWERLDAQHAAAQEDERRLMWGLVGASLASTAAGAGLMVTDAYDQGLRIAGAVTVGFALIDIALAAPALAGQSSARAAWKAKTAGREAGGLVLLRRAQGDFARDQGQLAWVFALNLGLDAGYIMAGAAGAAAAAFGVDHPERWLGGGLAAVAQGLILVAIDSVGFLRARGHQGAALEAIAGTPLPTVTWVREGGMVFGLAGRF